MSIIAYIKGMKKTKNGNTFLTGALILTAGGVLAKVLGAVYRIPLTNLLGSYAIGLYQLVFPLYTLLITVSMGFCVAVSRTIAREKRLHGCEDCGKILRCALIALGGIGAALSLALFLFAKPIATLQGNENVADGYRILSPAVLFVCLTGALRGYFQGQMKMQPTAVSQVAEQLAKLMLGLTFAKIFLPDEVRAVNGAILAVTLSEIISLAVFGIYFAVDKKGQKTAIKADGVMQSKEIYGTLFKAALPVTCAGVLAPLSQLIDSALILKLLTGDATRLYGIWSGAVHSLFVMPVTLSAGIGAAVLPDVSGNVAVGDMDGINKKVNTAFKLNNVIVMPCVTGFLFLSAPIVKLLYGGLPQEDLFVAARLLSAVSVGTLLLCYSGTFNSVLQGAGKEYVSLLFVTLSIVVRTVTNAILLQNQKVGIFAIAFSTILCYLVSVICSIVYLRKKVGIKLDLWSTFTKPLAACLALVAVILSARLLAGGLLETSVGTLAVIGFGAVVYGVAVVALKVFEGLLPTIAKKLKHGGKKYAGTCTD